MGNKEAEILSGRKLPDLLKKYGKDRPWLAKKLGLSESSINKWCTRENLSLKASISIRNILKELEVSADLLKAYELFAIALPKEISARVKTAAELSDKTVMEWVVDLIIENISVVPDFRDELGSYDDSPESEKNRIF